MKPATIPSAMTIAEAHDLLKANASRCPRIKKLFLRRGTIIVAKAKFTDFSVSKAKDGNLSIGTSYNATGAPWIISYIIYIAAIILLEVLAEEFYWPAIVPWVIWICVLGIDYLVMRHLSKPESDEVMAFINETLDSKR